MILQALNRYYEILAADPDCPIPRLGYSTEGVSFVLVISLEGELKAILPLFQMEMRGKKEVERPFRMVLPARVVRTVSIEPNFLWDNCEYMLGIPSKEDSDPAKVAKRFSSFSQHNLNLLQGVDCPEARALTAFFQAYDPQTVTMHPVIAEKLDDLKKGGWLVFKLEGSAHYAHDTHALRASWERHKNASASQIVGQCLVTGETAPIAILHTMVKGVRDAKSTGASLVGFNAPAYESYLRTKGQGLNAPTSEKAMFQYTTALNFLLSKDSPTPQFQLGDTTVVYWAESTNPQYADLFTALFDPDWVTTAGIQPGRDQAAEEHLRQIAEKVKRGDMLDAAGLLEGLDPDTRFYVLGLAPNAARVSVRFFHREPFTRIVQRLLAHYQDMQIVREFERQPARISVRTLLGETYSKKSQDKSAPPLLAGAVMRAILTGAPYPAALYATVINRIRADTDDKTKFIQKINYVRAAIIKACLTRKYRHLNQPKMEEILTMSLNEQSTHPAYLMGRLFAVLEKVQQEAVNPEATIKDRYFATACASPIQVFPTLLRLAQHHIAKAKYGYTYDIRIQAILNLLDLGERPFPAHLSLDEQGVFILGYYHQRAALYQPRAEKDAPLVSEER